MLGKAATRIATTLAAVLLFVTVSVTSGHAQATTGVIQGRITTSTGQPIAAAQVVVEGTTLGNTSNDQGYYFINQVPAGLHRIRAESIGFGSKLIIDQRILAGQTTTVDFQLAESAVQIAAIVVTGERNPLVPRDQVSSRAIVTGETIDNLPLDNAASIITLQPGVISTPDGFSIRGSREGEHAVYVDGVPVRNLRTGGTASVELGTNSLAQVDVTTGGIAARYGNAQSGVVNYVTRTGGSQFGGAFSMMTDRLSPEKIRGGFTRAELSFGGPAPMVSDLSFFFSTTLEGNKYGGQPQDNPYPIFVPSGIDTTFTLARTGLTAGATDSVEVVVPNWVEWDNGPTLPTGVNDEINMTSKLSYGLGRGSKLDLTYYYNRNQSITRGTAAILNPDAWGGNYSSENMVTLGGYFMLAQSAERQLALDVKASYMRDWAQSGALDRGYQESHLFPAFGFNAKPLQFIFDPDSYEITDELLQALRSGVLPTRILSLQPGKEIPTRQGVAGVSEALRLNPFAMRSGWNTSGIGNAGQAYSQENRMYFTATADWQLNRFNRIWVGGEMTKADSRTLSVPLYDGTPTASRFKPTTGGLFAQNRLDIGDVVLEAGVRMDYYDPNSTLSRVPAFTTNVPDSLKGDYYRLRAGDEPWDQRLERVVDCGGEATRAARTNATTGQAVCKDNFLPTKVRTVFSPKLMVSFPVTSASTFRMSYNQNVQPTSLTRLLQAQNTDLSSTNTNATFGREVDLPKTVLFEAGFRQVFGGNTVVDAAAYSKTTRNALSVRKVQYEDPVNESSLFLNVWTNSDYSLARGLDLKVDRKLSNIADLSMNYSFVDSRGTGSDPGTYINIIFRRTTNLSVLTGQPVEPAEVLLTNDQSRAHNVNGTLSMQFGDDYMEGSIGNRILGDLGVYATASVRSGLPYTRVLNEGTGQTLNGGLGGTGNLIEQLNASRGPNFYSLDVRVTKGFQVFNKGARLFVDARNPFNITNTNNIFAETGTIENDLWYDQQIQTILTTQNGTGTVTDRVIADWPAQNALNKYMLAQAEARFCGKVDGGSGCGDGIFSAAEQRETWGSYFNYTTGNAPFRMRTSTQLLRLGFEVVF